MIMERSMGVALVLICILCARPSASQGWYVFGDTYSDAGVQQTSGGLGLATYTQEVLQTREVFPQEPYSNGRFSNGPVWTEYVAATLAIPFVSFAAGGATTGAGYAQNVKNGPLPAGFAGYPGTVAVPAPNLFQLLDRFLQTANNTASADDIFTIFFGTNDYFSLALDGKNITADDVVNNIADVVDSLYGIGARRFILVTIPPLYAVAPSLTSNTALVQTRDEHNKLLLDYAVSMNSTYPDSSVNVYRYDLVVSKIFDAPADYGLTNSSQPCYPVVPAGQGYQSGVTPCTDPNAHYLWDTAHPTTAAHRLIGLEFVRQFGYLWGEANIQLAPTSAPSPG